MPTGSTVCMTSEMPNFQVLAVVVELPYRVGRGRWEAGRPHVDYGSAASGMVSQVISDSIQVINSCGLSIGSGLLSGHSCGVRVTCRCTSCVGPLLGCIYAISGHLVCVMGQCCMSRDFGLGIDGCILSSNSIRASRRILVVSGRLVRV